MEYIDYSNQGAVRNQPISGDLVSALDFLPDLGVTMEVFSGGQSAEGPNRVGSTRHDHGNAADVFFYKDGRKLDWSNPEDRPLFEEIVRRGRARGITGFGAGDNYMQPGSMHIGFGNEAVWGAGGKGENAPDWLRSAYYGADAPTGPGEPGYGGTPPFNPISGPERAPMGPDGGFGQSQNALAQREQPRRAANLLDPRAFQREVRPVNRLAFT